VSANEVKEATALRPPRRSWYRSPWLYVVIITGCLLLGAGAYWRLAPGGPEPPSLDATGLDPAVVAAVEEARAKVRESPRSAEAWGRLGMVLAVHDFRDKADVCLAEAEKLDPSEPRWPYYQALGALLVADAEAGLPKLERAVALCGDKYDAPRVRLAELLLSQNRLDEAEVHFRHLLQDNPRHPRAQLGLARIFAQRGDRRASLEPLTIAQKDPRTRKSACQLLAQIHQQLGNAALAEAARRQAADLPDDPYWPDPLNDEATELCRGMKSQIKRARRFAELDRDGEAIELLARTVSDYPDADDAWLQLGKSFLKLRNGWAAEQALQRATELAPDSHDNVFYLGNAFIVRGNLPAATACFRKAIELKPDFAPAHLNLGNTLINAGDTKGAIDAYRLAVRYEPSMFEAHLSLAAALERQGQYALALPHAQYAVQLKPSDKHAQKLLLVVLSELVVPLRLGDCSRAF
jgi:tetratricopeptide (TPR) repeat protein